MGYDDIDFAWVGAYIGERTMEKIAAAAGMVAKKIIRGGPRRSARIRNTGKMKPAGAPATPTAPTGGTPATPTAPAGGAPATPTAPTGGAPAAPTTPSTPAAQPSARRRARRRYMDRNGNIPASSGGPGGPGVPGTPKATAGGATGGAAGATGFGALKNFATQHPVGAGVMGGVGIGALGFGMGRATSGNNNYPRYY